MRKSTLLISFVLVALTMITSCSKFRKIQKSDDWRVKYEAAIDYYENKDYYRSIILFEDIMPFIRGTEESELVQFYFAYAHYYQKQYIMSSHLFKTFYDTYRRSSYAEEAYYMYAYSLYKQSPDHNLDQTSTIEAIIALQNFLNKYPGSDKRSEATDLMDKLRLKLETKAYENAKLYYDLGIYKSALIAMDNFEKDYPDSKLNEDILYLKIMTGYDFAKASIPSKQKERYYDTIEHYETFIDKYPSSKYVKELEQVYANSLDQIEKLKENNL